MWARVKTRPKVDMGKRCDMPLVQSVHRSDNGDLGWHRLVLVWFAHFHADFVHAWFSGRGCGVASDSGCLNHHDSSKIGGTTSRDVIGQTGCHSTQCTDMPHTYTVYIYDICIDWITSSLNHQVYRPIPMFIGCRWGLISVAGIVEIQKGSTLSFFGPFGLQVQRILNHIMSVGILLSFTRFYGFSRWPSFQAVCLLDSSQTLQDSCCQHCSQPLWPRSITGGLSWEAALRPMQKVSPFCVSWT